jgi:hypothetical protein
MQTSPHIYIDSDIPDGMTLTEWRRSQVSRTGRRPRLWHKVLGLA